MTNPVEARTSARSKVLLVEDHPLVREGLAGLIDDEPDLLACGGAGTIADGLRAAQQLQPDIVVIDLTLDGENGLDLIKRLRDAGLKMPVLVLSMHDETVHAERALRAGARGYVMKKEPAEVVMTAIRRVLSGGGYVSERVASKLVLQIGDPKAAQQDQGASVSRLSDRELEVLDLIGQGVGPSEMAKRLGVSVKTIETHRERIKQKLGFTTGAQLMKFAFEQRTT